MAVTITAYTSASFTNTTLDVTGVSWSNGDFIVVWSGGENAQDVQPGTPTNANLTFTSRQDQTSGDWQVSTARLSTAPATSTESSQTIAVSGGSGVGGSVVWVLSPGAGETFAYGGGWGNSNSSATTYNPSANSLIFYGHADWNASSNNDTATMLTASGTPNWRARGSDGGGGTWAWFAGDYNGVSAGSDTWGCSTYSGMQTRQVGVEVTATITLSSDQEGFRFREDSGNEATPTWLAAQDTNITGRAAETTTGVRVIVDYTGDPPSEAPKLQYRKVGDAATEWEDLA